MALDKLVDSSQLNGALSSTADAIRAKTGGTDNLTWDMDTGFAVQIGDISTGIDTSDATATAGDILDGKTAYANGEKIAGTIPTLVASDIMVSGKTVTVPVGKYTGASGATAVSTSVAVGTVTSGTASITSLTKTYNSTSGKFDVTGSANVSAPTVGTAGYVSSSEGTKNAKSGGATVSATLDKIVGSTVITGASTRKPSISKQATPSGVTNAASGDATTTAPTSGVYVAVKTSANTGTLTATPSVTTAGYGTADYHGIAGNTQTVGALASDTTYVPIATTSATVSGKTVSYGSGWISEGSKSVADGAYSASVSSHTISTTPAVTGSIAGTVTNIGTTTKPSGTDGTDYWTITPSGSVTTTGVSSAKGKATIGTAGYIAAGNKETSASTVNITPTVSNGAARYISKGAVTNNTSGGASSGTVNWGNQIKIGSGYYPSDTYYTAQAAPSGNIQLTQATSTDVSAYATATVRGVTAAISGGGLSGTATASGSSCSISDSTNNSGVSITTACTASRAKVSCTASTAGWASGTIKELAAGTGAMTAKTYYVNGVTLTAPSSGTRTFSVTVPNGSSTATFTFNVDTSGNVTITES